MIGKNSYSRYEKVRILSARALQISQGAPPLVKLPAGVHQPLRIAELEWEEGTIPIDIKRDRERGSA